MRRGLILLLALQNFLSMLGNVTEYMYFLKELKSLGISLMWVPIFASVSSLSYIVSTVFVNYPLIERLGRLTTGISASVVIGVSTLLMTALLSTKHR